MLSNNKPQNYSDSPSPAIQRQDAEVPYLSHLKRMVSAHFRLPKAPLPIFVESERRRRPKHHILIPRIILPKYAFHPLSSTNHQNRLCQVIPPSRSQSHPSLPPQLPGPPTHPWHPAANCLNRMHLAPLSLILTAISLSCSTSSLTST